MIKERNVMLIILFTVFTLGMYGIYWIIISTNEINELGGDTPSPWLLILFLIPYVNIFVALWYYWNYSKGIESVSDGRVNGIMVFILWILLGILAMIIVQIELNKHATDPFPKKVAL